MVGKNGSCGKALMLNTKKFMRIYYHCFEDSLCHLNLLATRSSQQLLIMHAENLSLVKYSSCQVFASIQYGYW